MKCHLETSEKKIKLCGFINTMLCVAVAGIFVFCTVFSARAATLAIDGNQEYQTIDGFGVNANSLSWNNGELIPALDMLADDMGVTLWRVVFDMEDWEATNDNADPSAFNWDYYNGVYSNAKFQNLWGTIGYLNQKGISSGIILSLMGRAPAWMGGGNGSVIDAALEDEWVEMVASLVYYAKVTMKLSFKMFDPLNEPDLNGYEGPQIDKFQYVRLLNKLAQKLDAMGLSDIRFVGPNTANVVSGVDNYIAEMLKDSVVMAKVDHFGLHNYSGTTDGADAAIRNSAYPDRNFYMTEITTPADILNVMDEGTAGICMWDAYDSVYNHAILMGYGSNPPNDAGNGPAPLAYNVTSKTYSARKVFHLYKHLFKYVPPGSVRIASTPSGSNIVLAFYHQPSGRVTIVGRNTGSGQVSYSGTLANLPVLGLFQFYRTSETDSTTNFSKGSDVIVSNRTFSFTAAGNSMFTLTGLVSGTDMTPPDVAVTGPVAGATLSNSVQLTAAASDNVEVAGVRFQLNGANLNGEILAAPYTLTWDTRTVVNGTYNVTAVARDISGNTATSLPNAVIVSNQDTTAPAVSVISPVQNAIVSGTIVVTAAATDTNGISGVQLLIDGAPLGSELVAAPYSVSLNTLALSDGTHTVAARARDTSGNSATSPAVSIRVLNNPGSVFPIHYIQKATNITTSAQTLAATFPSPVSAGTLIVVSVSGWPNLPAATPVTDSRGNSYRIAGTVLASQGAYSAIYYATNLSAGANTVTVRTVSSGGQISMAIAEFSGADTVSPLDKVAGSVGSGTAPSTGSMTPGMAGSLVVGSGTHNGNTITDAGAGFSMIGIPTEDSNTHQPLAMEYQVLSDTATTAATFVLAAAYPWTQNGAIFRPAVQQEPDTTAPVISITAPANNAAVSGMVAVSATATDNISVARVEFFLDNALQSSDVSSPYGWSWNTSPVQNGVHTIRATAYDPSGNNASSSVTVQVNNFIDVTAPTVAISAPANGATVAGTVAVRATATDDVGVIRVDFYRDGIFQASDTTSPYGWSWITLQSANGSYALSAIAYDAAGNAGQSGIVIVTVFNDTVAPVVAVTTPLNSETVTGTVTVTVVATDSGGVSRVEFYVNSVLQATDTSSPYSFSWNTAALVNGAYTITAKAYDAAGNVGTSSSVIVNASNPVVTPSTYSLWPVTTVPGIVDSGPDSAVELGVRFRSDVKGTITGIRFYKAAANTGTHVANLWSRNGSRLATATFTNETASGWQEVSFAAPVAATANTVYVASYHTNTGHYSYNQNYFTSAGIDRVPLHAPANTASSPNGLYAYGTNSRFPTLGWYSSNYWVDVVFKP